MIHELKTWSAYFNEVFMGHKTFEVRKADRDFKVGDKLILIEGDIKEGESEQNFSPYRYLYFKGRPIRDRRRLCSNVNPIT